MLKLPAGNQNCWAEFSLLLEHELEFCPGKLYYLKGNNGSGKSTFIKKCLFPALERIRTQNYRIYLEQQFHLQAYAIKAQASILNPEQRLVTQHDCLDYLFQDLWQAYTLEPRPVYVISDECHYLEYIHNQLCAMDIPFCLIYSIHGDNPLPQPFITYNFEPVTLQQSIIR